jgi:hypothetical protein
MLSITSSLTPCAHGNPLTHKMQSNNTIEGIDAMNSHPQAMTKTTTKAREEKKTFVTNENVNNEETKDAIELYHYILAGTSYHWPNSKRE